MLNKNVLSQTEVLIALQTTAPQDKVAIDAWVKENGDEEERDELMQGLAKLPKGVAWVWSPQWLECFERVHIRQRRTFDSSATPKVGTRRRDPKRRALPDLDEIRKSFEEIIQQTEADDPRLLRQRIHELEKELETRPTEVEVREVIKTHKVRLLPKTEINRLLRMGLKLETTLGRFTKALDDAYADNAASTEPRITPEREVERIKTANASRGRISKGAKKKIIEATQKSRAKISVDEADVSGIGKAHKAILTVLHTYGTRSKLQLAFLSGYVHSGGAFTNPLSNLRSRGWVEGRTEIKLTEKGRDYAAHYAGSVSLPFGSSLLNHWLGLSQFGKAHRAILEMVAHCWPEGITKQNLAQMTDYTVTGGAFNNPLSRLRSLKLIEGSKIISLTQEFGEAIDR